VAFFLSLLLPGRGETSMDPSAVMGGH
jgi:hypothetical protein